LAQKNHKRINLIHKNDLGHFYEFGAFRLSLREQFLMFHREQLKIPAKTFELLLFFVQNNNRLIDKETLMHEVWGGTFVEEANLTVHISTLRKIFAADADGLVKIETFPKRGYRFTAVVTEQRDGIPAKPAIEINSANSNITPLTNPSGIKELPDSDTKRKSKISVVIGIGLILLLIVAFVSYKMFDFRASFDRMKLTRIMDTGKSMEVAISPDGKYLALTIGEAGKQSLWIKHIATNSNVELIAPDSVSYSPLTFSNDGNYIFYALATKDDPKGTLYQIPVLGGKSKKILSNVNASISFAPDGEQFVFVRTVASGETALMIANLRGEERQLASRQKPDFFTPVGPAWSPDGKFIACAIGTLSGRRAANLFLISVEDGTEQQISTQKWRNIDRLAWLSDNSGLIAPAVELNGQEGGQIFFFPSVGGKALRITNDLNDYGGVSLAADSKMLATMQFDVRRNIWVLPDGDTNKGKSLTENLPDSYRFISWTPDQKIIYTSTMSGSRTIWLMDSDGSNRKQLTFSSSDDVQPIVTRDGRYIVFSSNRNPSGAYNIWRMNIDGTDLIQLTNGSDESQPDCTPDSEWILYVSGGMDSEFEKRTVWKVSINGGEPIKLTDYPSNRPDVSPDGKQFVAWYKKEKSTPWKVGLIPIEGGQPIRDFEMTQNSPLQWTRGGDAISFVKTEAAVSNVWSQPLNGESPKQITKFTTEQILFFDWSSDNQLVCSRNLTVRNAVLLHNFR